MTLLNRIAHNIDNQEQVSPALYFINERLEHELSQSLTHLAAIPDQMGLAARLYQSRQKKIWPQGSMKDQIGSNRGTSLHLSKIFALYKIIQPFEYSLEAGLCTIGRSELCQVVVPLKTVSRLHARIEREGPGYVLYDAESANGTFVNGHQIFKPYRLKDKDLIGLGVDAAMLRFEDPDSTLQVTPRLRYDPQTMTFLLNHKPVDLTPAQFRLLRHFYLNAGRVCTRANCAEAIWGRAYDPNQDAEALDRTMGSLRRQLCEIDPTADLIETCQELGYVLNL